MDDTGIRRNNMLRLTKGIPTVLVERDHSNHHWQFVWFVEANGRAYRPDGWYQRYALGEEPARYPLPTLIRRVDDCGRADGYFQRDAEGWITWGVYDFPLHDGSFMA